MGQLPMTQMAGPAAQCGQAARTLIPVSCFFYASMQVLAQSQLPHGPQDFQPQAQQAQPKQDDLGILIIDKCASFSWEVAQQQLMQVQRLEQMAHQLQASSLSSLSFRPEQSAPAERTSDFDRTLPALPAPPGVIPGATPGATSAPGPFEAASGPANAAKVVDVLTLATVRVWT